MVGMKEFCALLLAGGMGASSVVAVQKAKPAVSKTRAAPQKPKVQKAVQQSVRGSQIQECPTVAPIGPAIDSLVPLQTAETLFGLQPVGGLGNGGSGGGVGGGGGFGPGINPGPIPIAPGIPQPDTWVMLVAGFGFLGLALRRRPDTSDSGRRTLAKAGGARHRSQAGRYNL
jgi:hypothetical protein